MKINKQKKIIAERIKAARESVPGLTQEKLAIEIGVSPTMVYYYEHGTHTPGSNILLKIAKATGIKIEDFLDDTIESDVIKIDGKKMSVAEKMELLKNSHFGDSDRLRGVDDAQKKVIIRTIRGAFVRTKMARYENRETPIMPYATGAGGISLQEIEGSVRDAHAGDNNRIIVDVIFSYLPEKADFGIRVDGHSMEPTIYGDTVIYCQNSHNDSIRNNDIVVFFDKDDDELKVRRARRLKSGAIVLTPDNPTYPGAIELDDRTTVIGVVIYADNDCDYRGRLRQIKED